MACLRSHWFGAVTVLAGYPAVATADPADPGGSDTASGETAPADAQPLATGPGGRPWRIDLSAWVWMIGVDGTVGAEGIEADVDASFGDVLDASDSIFAFSGRLELGYGRWGGFVDGWYGRMGAEDQSGPLGVTDIDLEFEQVVTDFGVMYRLAQWEPRAVGQGSRLDGALDLYGGGRYTYVDLEIDPAMLDARSQDKGWVDPMLGARLTLPLSERLHAMVNGDIGGFGVSSDLTWSATALLGLDFTLFSAPATFYAGYRAIGWDYSDGSGRDAFEWDVVMHGPMIGLTLRF